VRTRRSLAVSLFVAVALLWLVAVTGTAAAADTGSAAPIPAVSIAGSGLTVHIAGANERHATGHIVLTNNGASAVTVTASAYFDGGPAEVTLGQPDVTSTSIPPQQSALIEVDFSLPKLSDIAGQLAISAQGGTTAVTPITISRSPTPDELWIVVAAAAGVAILVLVVGILLALVGGAGLSTQVGSGPSWSFSSSGAQNIAALGALLTTTLAASGFLSTVLPGVSTGDFVALSLLAAGAVAVAPLMMFNRPTAWRFALAAAFTMFGAAIEVGVFAQMVLYSIGNGPQRWFILAVLAGSGLVLLAYAEETIRNVVTKKPPSASTHIPPKNRHDVATAAAAAPTQPVHADKPNLLVNLL
jgi:hypothetical protein